MYYLTKSEFARQAMENADNLDLALLTEKPNEPCYAFASMADFRSWRASVQHCFEEIEL